jgi:predicted nicotinamide N-methyase
MGQGEEYVYDLNMKAGIICRELYSNMIDEGPVKCYKEKATDDYTGYTIWTSAVLLSKYAIQNPDLFQGKVCLELGAGCGLSGLAIACCTNAKSVAISDFPDETMVNLLHNISRNCKLLERKIILSKNDPNNDSILSIKRTVNENGEAVEDEIRLDDQFLSPSNVVTTALKMDWDHVETWPVDPATGELQTYDVIFASDIWYRRSYARKVAAVAEKLLRPGGLFLCMTPSIREGLSTMEKMMTSMGCSVEEESVPDDWRVNPLRTFSDHESITNEWKNTSADTSNVTPLEFSTNPSRFHGVKFVSEEELKGMFPEMGMLSYQIISIKYRRPE